MHNAPPVVYPVGRFVWGRWLFAAFCVLSAAGLIAWHKLSLATGPKLWAAGFVWAVCVLSAALWAPRQTLTGGRLGWSGESWFWQANADAGDHVQSVSVSVGLDSEAGILLWVQPLDEQGQAQGRLLCAWLQAGAMPPKWHGFRCAVYSRPMAAARSHKVPQARL